MKNTFRKGVSLAILASLLLTLNVNAAAVVTSASIDAGNDTVTVNVTTTLDFAADTITAFKLSDSDGLAVPSITMTNVDTSVSDQLTIDVTNSVAKALFVAGDVFSVSFVTTSGAFGSAVFASSAANEIEVSARVLPILSMKVEGGAVGFGDLVADTAVTANIDTTITVNTNAADGYVMQVANLGLENADGDTISAATAAEDISTGATNYGYGINAAVVTGASIDGKTSAVGVVDGVFDGSGLTDVSGMSTTATNLTTADGPVSGEVTTVSYHARVSALQETGNYTDTVTYSLTATF